MALLDAVEQGAAEAEEDLAPEGAAALWVGVQADAQGVYQCPISGFKSQVCGCFGIVLSGGSRSLRLASPTGYLLSSLRIGLTGMRVRSRVGWGAAIFFARAMGRSFIGGGLRSRVAKHPLLEALGLAKASWTLACRQECQQYFCASARVNSDQSQLFLLFSRPR